MIDSLQLTATKKVATPADWKVSCDGQESLNLYKMTAYITVQCRGYMTIFIVDIHIEAVRKVNKDDRPSCFPMKTLPTFRKMTKCMIFDFP